LEEGRRRHQAQIALRRRRTQFLIMNCFSYSSILFVFLPQQHNKYTKYLMPFQIERRKQTKKKKKKKN
jgi:hypothetical protein